MKKRKSFAALALIVAVLILGVGYAINNVDLTVTSDVKVNADDNNFKVEFTKAIVDNEGTGNTATVGDGTEATLHVESLSAVGDIIQATYIITNNSATGIEAALSSPSITYKNPDGDSIDADEYYEVTVDFNGSVDPVLAVGEEATLRVVVKLLKAPVNDITGNFTVSFNAQPQAA